MIDDGTIKEIVTVIEQKGWFNGTMKEDIGYKIKYRPNPTIVSTNTDAFVLNGVSTVDKIHGQCYVDRVHIDKNSSRAEVMNLMLEMLKAFWSNELMRDLDIHCLTFMPPGYNHQYLRQVESNSDVFELRLYAKGYPFNV